MTRIASVRALAAGSACAMSLVLSACGLLSSESTGLACAESITGPAGADYQVAPIEASASATDLATRPADAYDYMPAWFGYYADATTWPNSVTPVVCGHVNVSWVGSDSLADMTALLANLAYAHSQGLKVALMVPPDVFFEDDLTLAAKHVDNWTYFAYHVRPYISDVAFLYPVDEPYSQAKIVGTRAADMKVRLETVASRIKATFPSVPLAFSFSAIDFDTQESAFADLDSPLPANYDYFGFDCYGSWDRCGEPDYRAVHSIPWYVSQIKGRLNATQRIFLFADAFVRQARPADPARDAAEAELLLTRADQYYELALSDSSIIGLFGFLYQDDYVEDSQRFLGVRHWPALQARYIEIGRNITSK